MSMSLPTATPITYRPAQQAMATAIRHAIQSRTHLLLEAPTGEGKSFLLLQEAAAFIATRPEARVLIATPTKALQDQYAAEAAKAGRSSEVAILKGLAAYVCVREFMTHCPSEHQTEQLIQITRAGGAIDGAEQADMTRYATDHDGCDGADCPHYAPTDPNTPGCFYHTAMLNAERARIVIISHAALATHLLLARQNDIGYLPPADLLMIDEAHVWPSQMALVLSKQITIGRLQEQAHSLINGQNAITAISRGTKAPLTRFIQHCEESNRQALQLLGPRHDLLLHSPWCLTSAAMEQHRRIAQHILTNLADALEHLLATLKSKTKTLPNTPQARGARRILKRWTTDLHTMRAFAEPLGPIRDDHRYDAMALNRTTTELHLERSAAATPRVTFLRQPTRVRRFLYHLLCEPLPIIFTSGTLRTRLGAHVPVEQQVLDTLHELGFYGNRDNEPAPPVTVSCHASTLDPHVTLHLAGSDYPAVATGTPTGEYDPLDLEHEWIDYSTPSDAWLDATIRLLTDLAHRPGAIYVLCTSYIALRALDQRLRACSTFPRDIFAEQPNFTQEPRRALRERPDQTLVLSVSGWEGVDLPAIRHLIIHRLPFHVVNLDLYEEGRQRREIITTVTPRTSIRLRQGIGRAIRTHGDHCDIYLLDKRFPRWASQLLGMSFTIDERTGRVSLRSPHHALWPTTRLATIRLTPEESHPTESCATPEPSAPPPVPVMPRMRSWLTSLLGGSRA